MAESGTAGEAGLGKAGHGRAGEAGQGKAWLGKARHGVMGITIKGPNFHHDNETKRNKQP